MGYGNSKEFPYELKESDNHFSGNSIFTLHHGISKEDGSPVSIFRFEKTNLAELSKVENASKRLKVMRHPNILRYITSVDLPNAYFIVTEPVKSIYECIDEIRKYPDWCAWGLSQLITALDFLGPKQCQLVHCNLNFNSIFITKAGDWKLGGMEYVGEPLEKYSFLNEKEKFLNSMLKLYRPPESSNANAWKGPNFAFDAYQFAAFIFQVYNSEIDPNNSSLSNQNIPKGLVQQFTKLSNGNVNSRASLSQTLTSPFFQNPLINACTFIENITLKDTNEKDAFFKSLEPLVDNVPPSVCKYKFLPLLVRALDFGSANSKVLGPILKIGTLLTPEEYAEHVTPSVAKWFESPDRNLRLNLLQNLSSFADHLPRDLINNKIFPHISQGFLDTNETIRELTVISIVHIISKLDERHISTQLLKSLAKLQIDPIAKIRTNTTICLGKISAYIPKQQRPQVLIPAFTRSLQDPFLHARLAGILSLSATQQYYGKEEVAKRIIPSLSYLTIDPELKVRQAAFSTIKSFIMKLEMISEKGDQPESEDQIEAQSSSMFGWVSSISSKFYSGGSKSPPDPSKPSTTINNNNNESKAVTVVNNNNNNVINDDDDEEWNGDWKDVNEGDDDDWNFSGSKKVVEKVKEKTAKQSPQTNRLNNAGNNKQSPKQTPSNNNNKNSKQQSTSGWNDWNEDGDIDDDFADAIPHPANVTPSSSSSSPSSSSSSPSSIKTAASKLAVQSTNNSTGGWGGWDEELDDDIDDVPVKGNNQINATKSEVKNSFAVSAEDDDGGDGWGDDDWSKPIPTSPPATKKSEAESAQAGGWGDDWDDFDKPAEKKMSKMELAKLKKEQKKTAGKKA